MTTEDRPFQYQYAHMCRDGHAQIGHNDSESEMCPLCRSITSLEFESLPRLQAEVTEWQSVTFPGSTAQSKIVHLGKEVSELAGDPSDASEIADVLILLIGIASLADVDLLTAVRRKMDINRSRTWGVPDADGVVEHVRVDPGDA